MTRRNFLLLFLRAKTLLHQCRCIISTSCSDHCARSYADISSAGPTPGHSLCQTWVRNSHRTHTHTFSCLSCLSVRSGKRLSGMWRKSADTISIFKILICPRFSLHFCFLKICYWHYEMASNTHTHTEEVVDRGDLVKWKCSPFVFPGIKDVSINHQHSHSDISADNSNVQSVFLFIFFYYTFINAHTDWCEHSLTHTHTTLFMWCFIRARQEALQKLATFFYSTKPVEPAARYKITHTDTHLKRKWERDMVL